MLDQLTGVMSVVDARFSGGVDVWWRDPFGPARVCGMVGRRPRRPSGRTVVDLSMAGVADQGETLDVGVSALVPVRDMVHRTQTRRCRAPRPGATPIRGDQREPLVGVGQTTSPTKVQWTTRMVE
nr:hypothetical protein GCM10017611_10730 [Rhodococcus wratislaviensis]